MEINRRTLLASGATFASLSYLGGQTRAEAAAYPQLPEGAVIMTAMVKAKPGQEASVREALLSMV